MIVTPVNHAIDFIEATIYDGVTCLGLSPATITTTAAQWNFSVAVPLDTARLKAPKEIGAARDSVRVRLSIHVRAGCLGVGMRSRRDGRFYDELWIPVGKGFDEFEVFAPIEDAGTDLILRNVWPDGPSEAVCRILAAEYGAPGHYYLVHGVGKVATQSVEAAIRQRTGQIDRLHLLGEKSLQRTEGYYRSHNQPVPEDLAGQIVRGRSTRRRLEEVKDRESWVAIGFRDPLDLAIASFFQNILLYRPDLTFDEDHREAELAWSEQEFNSIFREDRGLSSIDAWMTDEVCGLHELDVYRHEIGDAPYLVIDGGERRRFMFYRLETLRENFSEVLRILGISLVGPVLVQNIGSDKESGPLYRAFRARFEPSLAMIEAFYNTRYFAHFYGDAPNYESLPAALRRARTPFLRRRG